MEKVDWYRRIQAAVDEEDVYFVGGGHVACQRCKGGGIYKIVGGDEEYCWFVSEIWFLGNRDFELRPMT